MDGQNLAYALTQVGHNFGAVIVVAAPLYALATARSAGARGVLWLALAGWALQLASGGLFGLVSYHFYGQLPDIHGIAIGALVLKLLCALTAVALLALSLLRPPAATDGGGGAARWRILAALGATALAAAAFLRWFS
ncbi:hypothetical protein [Ottowia sp.]|uniref:hypothetical protein n=1 Tax=Ottowia sp. TaxID=1898956 RepID=UPI0025EE3DF9|nr:hypothetical protein [Ottowia sp.]